MLNVDTALFGMQDMRILAAGDEMAPDNDTVINPAAPIVADVALSITVVPSHSLLWKVRAAAESVTVIVPDAYQMPDDPCDTDGPSL